MKQLQTLTMPIACASALFSAVCNAQVLADFEDGDISQWLIEADGTSTLAAAGYPGNCLRVVDQGLGIFHKVVAPASFAGDFTGATPLDSLSFDLRVQRSGTLNTVDPLFSLVGPSAMAIAFTGYVPPNNVWHHVAIAFDPSAWTMVSGTWEDLMEAVSFIRIRTEFTYGAETAWLDNVALTFSPGISAIEGTVCSDWQAVDDLDGWSFQNVGSIQVSTTQGNPPGSVRLGDASGITYAVAAPKFRGDWSALDGLATMSFHLFLQTSSSNYYDKEYLVKLSGPGGSAKYLTNDSLTALTVNQWRTYELPLDENAWEVLSGTWEGLLSQVTEIRLELEFIATQSETCFLDNFCLNTGLVTATWRHTTMPVVELFPNPTSGILTLVLNSITGRAKAMVFDPQGRKVGGTIRLDGAQRHTLDLSNEANGLYMLRVTSDAGTIIKHIVLQH